MKECNNDFSNSNLIFDYNLQWFASNGEGGEKTEPATDKKLKDAREEGKVAKSKELTAAFDLIVLFLVLKIFISYVGGSLLDIFDFVYSGMPDFVEINEAKLTTFAISSYLFNIILKWILIVLPFFLLGVAITILISIFQVGWKISTKPMKPKLEKFNPINGFKRIFSKNSLFELVKSIVKIGVIAYVAYSSVINNRNDLFLLYDIPLNQAITLIGSIIINTGLKISLVYLVVGFADYAYQKHKFNEDMKMTKQEVKD